MVVGDAPSVDHDESGKVSQSSEFLGLIEAFSETGQEDRLFYIPAVLCKPYSEIDGQRTPLKIDKTSHKRCLKHWVHPVIKHLDPKAIIGMGPLGTFATLGRLDYFALVGRSMRYGATEIPVYPVWHYDHTGIDQKRLLPKFHELLVDTIRSIDTIRVAKLEEVASQNYTLGVTAEIVEDWFKRVYEDPKKRPLGWDVETTGLDIYRTGFRVGIFSFDHPANPDNPLVVLTEYDYAESIYRREHPSNQTPWSLQKARIEAVLKRVLEDPSIRKIGHNLQFDECAVRSYYGWDLKGFHADTLILNYLLNPDEVGFSGLESLIRRYLPDIPEYWKILDDWKEEYARVNGVPHNGNYLAIPEDVILPYAAFDTVVVTKLYRKLYKILKEHSVNGTRGGYFTINNKDDPSAPPFRETYTPLEYAIYGRSVHHKLCTHLQTIGQHVDLELVEQIFNVYDSDCKRLVDELEQDELLREFEQHHLHLHVGKSGDQRKALNRGESIKINWASPKQVRGFFIDFLKLPILKRTEKGGVCLDESVVGDYANTPWYKEAGGNLTNVPIPDQTPWTCTSAKKLASYRKARKFIDSFLEPIRSGAVVHSDKLLHTNFKSAFVSTGRLSASNPNTQSIPRDGLVKKLYCSRYREGWMLTRDYSGLEVRILTLFCRDPLLVKTFMEGGDVHFNTQRHFFGDKADKKNKTQRSICKQALFGNIFGQGDKGLFDLLTENRVISPATGKPVTLEECKEFNKKIYELYPKVGEWIQFAHAAGITDKWVSSAFGFVRNLPEFESYRAYEEAQAKYSWEERRSNRFLSQLGAMIAQAKRRSQNCCDELTEALTRDGWKSYSELSLEDELLTKNPDTGEFEWHRPHNICIFEKSETSLALVETGTFSACTTPDHRWLVTEACGWEKEKKALIKNTSQVILSEGRFAIHRTGKYCQPEAPISDRALALIGWYVTDASIAEGISDRPRAVVIGQSSRKKGNCERIRQLFGDITVSETSEVSETDECPFLRWRINAETSKEVIEMLPERKLTYEFIWSLSKRQATVLLDEMVRRGGSVGEAKPSRTGCVSLYAESKEEADLIQALATASGIASNSGLSKCDSRKSGKPITPTGPAWEVSLLAKDTTQILPDQVEWVHDNRLVWCPQVKNETFVARRNGCAYVTGNTSIQSTAADITTFAAWRTNELFIERGLDTRVTLVIHDDIHCDVPHRDEMVEASRILTYTMDNLSSWIHEMLPGYDAGWIGDFPIVGDCEIGLNPKDALPTVEEPKWDGSGSLVLNGGQREDGSIIKLDWQKDYDQIREICFLKKLRLDT